MDLGFFRSEAGGYQTVGHNGIWPGFHSAMLLVPGQGLLSSRSPTWGRSALSR